MADDDDDGWGSPVNEGWTAPQSPQPPPYGAPGGPTAPVPPPYGGSAEPPTQSYQPYGPPGGAPGGGYPTAPYQPVGYGAPGGPGAPLPGAVPPPKRSGGMSGRTLAILVVVLVVVAGGVIAGVVASSGGSKKHSASSSSPAPTSPLLSSSSSSGFPSTSPASSASSSTPDVSTSPATSPAGSDSAGSTSANLLSISPFSNCEAAALDPLTDAKPTGKIACTGSDVQQEEATGIIYEQFATTTDLSTFYTQDVLAKNGITANVGDCATLKVETTTKSAQFCEGAFTDDTGAAARELLVVAPIAVDIVIGGGPISDACTGASSYTLMVVTSPSDRVAVGAIACSGTAAIATAFQKELTDGDFDLND